MFDLTGMFGILGTNPLLEQGMTESDHGSRGEGNSECSEKQLRKAGIKKTGSRDESQEFLRSVDLVSHSQRNGKAAPGSRLQRGKLGLVLE